MVHSLPPVQEVPSSTPGLSGVVVHSLPPVQEVPSSNLGLTTSATTYRIILGIRDYYCLIGHEKSNHAYLPMLILWACFDGKMGLRG